MRIFLASSSYAPIDENGNIDRKNKMGINENIKQIIETLDLEGHIVIPWWSDEVWEDSDTVWESLIKSIDKFDAGIFIFGEDHIKTNKIGEQSYVTNANVLIEFGMYINSKGRRKALAIYDFKEKSSSKINYEIPSDLTGVIYPKLEDRDLKERVKTFFGDKRPYKFSYSNRIKLYKSKDLANRFFTKNFNDWKTKGLFIGTESAILWDKIEEHRNYEKNINLILEIIKRITKDDYTFFQKINSVVSFRPGNGKTDERLISSIIAEKNKKICKLKDLLYYVPIDINYMLLFKSIERINNTQAEIPFGIVDDFENNFRDIKDILEDRLIDGCKLFLMLGATFSNLDDSEQDFINKIDTWMNKGDYILIDVLIKDNTDPIVKYKDFLEENEEMPDYKSLLVNSIKKRFLYDKEINEENYKNIKDKINIYKKDTSSKFDFTELENTEVVSISYEPERKDILISKLYKFQEIKAMFEERFSIINFINGNQLKNEKKINRAVFLLNK